MRASRAVLLGTFAALLAAASQASAQSASSSATRPGAAAKAPAAKQSKSTGKTRLSDQAMRLAVLRIADASFRIPFVEAPKLTDARIIGPTDVTKPPGPRETHYCASASVGPFPLVFRAASIRFTEQPDGKVQIQTRIFVRSGPCHGDGVKPFPELERARAARRKALGRTD